MKKRKQTRKKKIRGHLTFTGKCCVFMLVTILVNLVSSLFINCGNINLTMKIQDIEADCEKLEEEMVTIQNNIQQLSSRERIYEIAETRGLTSILDSFDYTDTIQTDSAE